MQPAANRRAVGVVFDALPSLKYAARREAGLPQNKDGFEDEAASMHTMDLKTTNRFDDQISSESVLQIAGSQDKMLSLSPQRAVALVLFEVKSKVKGNWWQRQQKSYPAQARSRLPTLRGCT